MSTTKGPENIRDIDNPPTMKCDPQKKSSADRILKLTESMKSPATTSFEHEVALLGTLLKSVGDKILTDDPAYQLKKTTLAGLAKITRSMSDSILAKLSRKTIFYTS